jgi:hypothetical protein
MTGCLSYRPQKGQKGTFWTISALEHSKVCTLFDFGHLQFLCINFFRYTKGTVIFFSFQVINLVRGPIIGLLLFRAQLESDALSRKQDTKEARQARVRAHFIKQKHKRMKKQSSKLHITHYNNLL